MATKTGNTAAGPVMLRPDELDRYAPANLLLYRTSLALMRNPTDNGVFTEAEYCEIRTIFNKNTVYLRVVFLRKLLDLCAGQSEHVVPQYDTKEESHGANRSAAVLSKS